MCWEEFDHISCTGVGDVDPITSVMFEGWAEIPSIYSMVSPCASLFGFFMYDDLGSHRCQWCLVEVEHAVYLVVG